MNKLKRFLIKKILPTLLCFVIISQVISINALPSYADDTDTSSYSQSSDMSNPESDSSTDSSKKTEKNDSSSKKDDSSGTGDSSNDSNQLEVDENNDSTSIGDSNSDDDQTDAEKNEDENSSEEDDADDNSDDDDQTDADEDADEDNEDSDIINLNDMSSSAAYDPNGKKTSEMDKLFDLKDMMIKKLTIITPGGFIQNMVLDPMEKAFVNKLDAEGKAYVEWLNGSISDLANALYPMPQNAIVGIATSVNTLSNGVKDIEDGKVFDGVTKTTEAAGGTLISIPYPPVQAVGLAIKSVSRGARAIKESINKRGCLTGDVLITMADGTLKKVKDIESGDMVMTWNFYKGEAEPQPVVFNDILETKMYAVVNVTFDDGTEVEIVGEHGFFDLDAGEYVYFNTEASKYIGHSFAKLSDDGKCKSVKLIKVDVTDEIIEIYSPVSAKNFCIYANGMLSMPGDVYGFFNYFDVDTDNMKYNKEKMTADIEKYGEYTYADFSDILSEEMYDAFDLKYMKVSVGKGLISWEDIENKIEKYNEYLK